MYHELDHYTFQSILSEFYSNIGHTKRLSKERLSKKFDWLSKDHETVSLLPNIVLETVDERVTVLNLPEHLVLTRQEKDLLSLGPKFAITPSNKKIREDIKINFTEAAVKARWKDSITEKDSCQTLADYVNSSSPFQKSYYPVPPEINTESEHDLKKLAIYTYQQLEQTKLCSNLTKHQRAGLLSLQEKSDKLHKSVKCFG